MLAVDLHPDDRRSAPRVSGAHPHVAHPAEAPLTGRHTHLADRATDEAAAHRPLAAAATHPVTVEVMALHEPGVEAGQHVGGRAGQFGVDGDDGRADEPIGRACPRQRVELLDSERPIHRGGGDADFCRRFDEGLLVDHAGQRECAQSIVGELAGPPEHATHGVPVERLPHHGDQDRAHGVDRWLDGRRSEAASEFYGRTR